RGEVVTEDDRAKRARSGARTRSPRDEGMPVRRKILYGVTGEGLGHAMRSRVIAAHLRAQGHEVKLVASGRAHGYLARHFDDVQAIPGFAMTYVRGQVARARTLLAIGRAARRALNDSVALYRRSIAGFQPDVCLS